MDVEETIERTPCNRFTDEGKLIPKELYRTFDAAKRVAIERNFKNGLNKTRLAAYQCSICNNYHVGRTNKLITRGYANRAKGELFSVKVVGKIDLSKFKGKRK